MKIPFLDLVTPHLELEEELWPYSKRHFDRGLYRGTEVEGLRTNSPHSVRQSIVSGSAAERMRCGSLSGGGIKPGTSSSRFQTPSLRRRRPFPRLARHPPSSTSTSAPTTWTREAPRVSGNEPQIGGSGQVTVHKKTGTRVAAVIPVHLYGQPADMDPILELAERYNLVVIEDACQAHGAQYFSRKARPLVGAVHGEAQPSAFIRARIWVHAVKPGR